MYSDSTRAFIVTHLYIIQILTFVNWYVRDFLKQNSTFNLRKSLIEWFQYPDITQIKNFRFLSKYNRSDYYLHNSFWLCSNSVSVSLRASKFDALILALQRAYEEAYSILPGMFKNISCCEKDCNLFILWSVSCNSGYRPSPIRINDSNNYLDFFNSRQN